MLRVALFVLVLIIILVAISYPKFRRSLGLTLVAVMGAIGIIIWQDSQERQLEYERISAAQILLEQMQIRPGLNTRSFVVNGRLHNLAENYTILSIELQATVKDCVVEECTIVGQEETQFPLEVPPLQSRDFSVTIPFAVAPEFQGEAHWEYHVLKIRAQ